MRREIRKSLVISILLILFPLIEIFPQEEGFLFWREKFSSFLDRNDFQGAEEFLKEDKIPLLFKDYLRALFYYHRLKYWEESREWNKFYSQKDSYYESIINFLQGVRARASRASLLKIESSLLLGLVYKEREDPSYRDYLKEILEEIPVYLRTTQDTDSILDVADRLYRAGERNISNNIYKSLTVAIDEGIPFSLEKIKNIAQRIYSQDRKYSLMLYDIYIKRARGILPREKLRKEFKEILFASLDFGFKSKTLDEKKFAEEVLGILEEEGAVLDNSLLYLRAYNLERLKDYSEAVKFYEMLLSRDIDSLYIPEIIFKLGLLNFLENDFKTSQDYFSRLFEEYRESNFSPLGMYLLGVYYHYRGDFSRAQSYYRKIQNIEDKELESLLRIRLEELSKQKLSKNIKIYFDLVLGKIRPQGSTYLKPLPSRALVEEEVKIRASHFIPGAGCMQPEMVYLWWGLLGKNKYPSLSSFITSYSFPGCKVVFSTIQMPSGFLNKDGDILDIYHLKIHNFKKVYKKDEEFNVSIGITPPLFPGAYRIRLSLYRDEEILVQEEGTDLKRKLASEGNYRLVFSLHTPPGSLLLRKEFPFRVE